MKSWLNGFLLRLLRWGLRLRYRTKVKGLEKIPHAKGILFLGNHPSELDTLFLGAHLWPKHPFRFVAAEFTLHLPIFGSIARWFKTIPIPEFANASNSYKVEALNKTFDACLSALNQGENLFVFPAGHLTRGGKEVLTGGTSVQEILKKRPETKIVLVRLRGLRGSLFSAGPSNQFLPIMQAAKIAAKYLFRACFLLPKRDVELEFHYLEEGLSEDRREYKNTLEGWFNRGGEEPLTMIPYSYWSKKIPEALTRANKPQVSLDEISDELKERVLSTLEEFLPNRENPLTMETSFIYDLDMDSLDRAELVALLEEKFYVKQVSGSDLMTVGDFLRLAHLGKGEILRETVGALSEKRIGARRKKLDALSVKGESIIERFLEVAKARPNGICLGDLMSGELTFKQVKQRVCVLAEAFKKMPQKNIGVMLPASSAVYIVILALMLARKVPVMLNWTVGERNLNTAIQRGECEITITSWRFVNRLSNVQFGNAGKQFLFLEEFSRRISFKNKLKGFLLSKKSSSSLLNYFGKSRSDDLATILFSSGTGAAPKTIPLTHKNILSNIDGIAQVFRFNKGDAGLSFLPPFHSFGFVCCGYFMILSGVPLYLTPNPTDGLAIQRMLELTQANLTAMPPTFLANILRVVEPSALSGIRAVLVGGEKPGKHLFEECRERFPKMEIIEGYGITECSPVITMNARGEEKVGSGRPLPGVEVKIVDPDTLQEKPSKQVGVILTRSNCVFGGYLGEEPTPFVYLGNERWYNTEDLGSLDEKGNLILQGRVKRCIKIGGEMISLSALETALNEAAAEKKWDVDALVPAFCAGAIEKDDQKTKLFLVTTIDLTLREANTILKKWGFSSLAFFTKVVKMVHMPVSGTGKLNYREIQSFVENEVEKRNAPSTI